MNRRFLSCLLVGVLGLSGLRASADPLEGNETIKLPSGRLAKILTVSQIEYSKGVMALMVRYQTTLSIDEKKAVNQEVDDIWKLAQKDAEHFGYGEAVISLNETPKGVFITSSRMVNFIYERAADGSWKRFNRDSAIAAQ